MHGETQAVQSKLLHEALTDFAEDASRAMQAQLAAGAEMPFELQAGVGRLRAGGRGASLQLYSPQTGRFISEHWRMLCELRSHRLAACALEAYRGLERYLSSVRPQGDMRSPVRSTLATQALRAFLEDVFSEQSDLGLRTPRIQAALARIDAAGCTEASAITMLSSLHGLALVSAQLPMSAQLTLSRPEALSELPEQAMWLAGNASKDGDRDHLLVVLEIPDIDGRLDRALTHCREMLLDLLRGLRLYGDGRIALGPLALACAGGNTFAPVALGIGGRPDGVLIVPPEQEDELRAFCNLVSRRTPPGDTLAWAMRRFELGCERDSEIEALSDHLLALQALLEPERVAPGLLASRTAALCAQLGDRKRIASRVLRALQLERDAIRGEAVQSAAAIELAREIASHVRTLLRDVICGRLHPELRALADETILTSEEKTGEEKTGEEKTEVQRARIQKRRGRNADPEKTEVQGALPI